MSYDSIPENTKGWDLFLTERYKYGIFNFAYCVGDIIQSSARQYRYPPGTDFPRAFKYRYNQHMNIEIKRRKKLKTKIIKTYYDSLCDCGLLEDGGPTEKDINFLLDLYSEAKQFLNKLDKEIEAYKNSLLKKRGAPGKVYNKIAFVWTQVMKSKRGINWHYLWRFLDWFSNRLKETEYYNTIDNEKFNEYSLKNEYYKIIGNKKNRLEIETLKKKFFPEPNILLPIRIEFKKEYVNIDDILRNLPLITFPDGEELYLRHLNYLPPANFQI